MSVQIGCKLPWDRFPWSHNETCVSIHQYRFIIFNAPHFHIVFQCFDVGRWDRNTSWNSLPYDSNINQEIRATLQQDSCGGLGWDLPKDWVPQTLQVLEVQNCWRQTSDSLQVRGLLVQPAHLVQRHFRRDGGVDLPLDFSCGGVRRLSWSFSRRLLHVLVGRSQCGQEKLFRTL